MYEQDKKSTSFEISTLINRNIVDTINIEENSGLNKEVLYKYNTIKQYENDRTSHFVKRLGYTGSNKWVILRSLRKDYYDIMVSGKQVIFDKNFIDKLDRGGSPRVDSYQTMCNEELKKFLKTPKVILEEKINTNNIVSNLFISVSNLIERKIKSKKPKNLKELSVILQDKKIESTIFDVLMKEIDEKNPEIVITFMSSVYYITRSFMKYINTEFSKIGFVESMFDTKTEQDSTIIQPVV